VADVVQIQNYKAIAEHLRAAMDMIALSEQQVVDVTGYLDHDELGLAYEEILEICVEASLAIDDAARNELHTAGRLMGFDVESPVVSVEYQKRSPN